ncbi:MAG: hypothetical protein WAR39_01665 [Prevotella sp.]
MKKNCCNSDTFVKIEFYNQNFHVEDVIYYIERIPFDLAYKYLWYFEYLVALVKIHHPHNTVKLLCGHQTLPLREKYIEDKFKTQISHKKSKLKKLESDNGANDDFFGFDKNAREDKIKCITEEIKKLENGEITFYIPYVEGGTINKIKKYIK